MVDVPIPPAPGYFITDTAHVISASTQKRVEDELEAFERKTTDQVVVWIGDSTGDTPLEDWTVKAAQKWGIGQRGKDNGVVLFLFVKDRRVRIEVGYGLEATLTDATSARIENDTIEPAMRSGNPDEAVTDGVAAILHAIDSDAPGSAPPPSEPKPSFNLFGAIGGGFAFIGHLIHSIGIFLKWTVGGFILIIVVLYFFSGLFGWMRTGKPDPDWAAAFEAEPDDPPGSQT